MADIFISYAREDRDYAHALAEICLGHGWTVWWDRKIPVGKSFSEVIERELQAARSVIVVWSSRSVTSEWVQNEAADAAERRILIPVLVEDVRIPLEFRRIHAARLVGWKPGDNQPELDDLFSSLAALLGLPSQAVGSVAGPAAAVQSRTPVEPKVVVPEAPFVPLGAAATTADASLLSEKPTIEPPAVVAISFSDESVQDAKSVEPETRVEPGNARGPLEPAVVVPEIPSAPLSAVATTDASLLSEPPPIEAPAVMATSVSDESVQDAKTPAETATGFEPVNARGPFSRRTRIAIVAVVAVASILLGVAVLRPREYRSVIRPEDSGPVPHYARTTLDLTRAQFQIGIVNGVGEKLRLVNSIFNLTERDVASAGLPQLGDTTVSIRFSPTGASKMRALTTANVGKQLGFVRNGDVVFHIVIDAPVSDYAQVSFSSTSEAKEFLMKLEGQASTAPRANSSVAESALAPASSGAVGTPAPAMLDEAQVQLLRDVVDRDPKHAAARAQLGNLYYDAGRYTEAIKWYAESVAINPKDVNVSNDLGVSYYYNKQTDLALKQLEHSLRIDPKNTNALLNMGIVRAFGKQDLKGAAEVWRRLVEIAPNSNEGRQARQALEVLSSSPGSVQ